MFLFLTLCFFCASALNAVKKIVECAILHCCISLFFARSPVPLILFSYSADFIFSSLKLVNLLQNFFTRAPRLRANKTSCFWKFIFITLLHAAERAKNFVGRLVFQANISFFFFRLRILFAFRCELSVFFEPTKKISMPDYFETAIPKKPQPTEYRKVYDDWN